MLTLLQHQNIEKTAGITETCSQSCSTSADGSNNTKCRCSTSCNSIIINNRRIGTSRSEWRQTTGPNDNDE